MRYLPILGALALAGCVATQNDVLEMENQMAEFKGTISSLQANQADLLVKFQRVHEDLAAFMEARKQSQDDLSRLSSKIDDLAAIITAKVSAIGAGLTATQAKSIDEQKAALAKTLQQGASTELFHEAEVRLAKKSYDLAAKGFEDYIARFPQGALVDVAVYNLGDSYYGLRKWEPAGRQYALYLEKYPKTGLTPTARLMYALCLVHMRKNLAEARQYLSSVVSDFPESPEAKAAALEIKKLPKTPK